MSTRQIVSGLVVMGTPVGTTTTGDGSMDSTVFHVNNELLFDS